MQLYLVLTKKESSLCFGCSFSNFQLKNNLIFNYIKKIVIKWDNIQTLKGKKRKTGSWAPVV